MSDSSDTAAHIPVDLVFYCELFIRKEGDKKTFEITVRAKDLERPGDLSFPDPCGVTEVVADVQGTVGEDLKPYVDLLVDKVYRRFPRHCRPVQLARRHWYSRRKDVWVPLGEDDRMFDGMKLNLYQGTREWICGGTIIHVDHNVSLVKPHERREQLKDGIMAVTE